MTAGTAQPTPKLLKARQRHSRWFVMLLIPLIVFSMGMANPDSLWHELGDWGGYFLVIICVLGRAYCSSYIGGIKNEGIMRMGPYAIVRNPLYVFSFIGLLGIGLQSGSVSILVLLVITFLAYYKQVVAKEEAFLEHKFGDAYRVYKAEVPRWIPKFTLWQEPQEVLTRPYFIRHTMMDAVPFFMALPLFELLETLHESGVIPVMLVLP
ncbi:MAG: isoprenylcysteine carboxylmethyltransferase family protein [Rickettsiales bacterium]|nr:isoprenylcysteine carboxylmethyltransferase family protein [Rickettsiales bacterium]